ncbi:class I SAM-dependent methyltransferase [Nocardia colli]|uniref:S-adenosyl-L-methionine-dependent methyltransferase n=1 Tax=Nocardia colli TaxID=2545717 RepID=A0A5N0EC66_9NOCA|nr:class I SAM-dependent methyltransferase [Nocardia colli]KAA8885725.1 class I SAM-dependent methyltransferase [Nocardia colli]
MQLGQPSRTALGAARARAFHQDADEPRIFDDPLAALIAKAVDAAVEEGPSDDGIPMEARLFLAIRHRFAEGELSARADTIRQVVVLGAGLDTFGLRNPYPGITVFEVDHPDTQAWKRARVADAGIPVPPSLRFVPVNFETDSLGERLAAAGFDRSAPTFFLWLGVVQYLTAAAVDATLRFIADLPAPARVILDYSEPISALPPQNKGNAEALARVMERLGEPWLSLFTDDEIAAKLTEFGFDEIEDLNWGRMIARFAPTSAAADRVGGHVLSAAHPGHAAASREGT